MSNPQPPQPPNEPVPVTLPVTLIQKEGDVPVTLVQGDGEEVRLEAGTPHPKADDLQPVTIDPLTARAEHLAKLVASLNDSVAESNIAISESNERISESNERIGELVTTARHNRKMIRGLVAAMALALAALVGTGYLFTKSNAASDEATNAAQVAATAAELANNQADALRDALVLSCQTGNDSRVKVVQLWEFLVALTPQPTTDQKAKSDQLLAYVRDTYKSKDCAVTAVPVVEPTKP